ncbi:MAG TPA: class III extradiol ring-cleavage dioxygenase [Rugosibacter sp.]|nr:class III extradiol ring-cleavage dioxygenase [Rugosibacter sp.]HQN46866.1 class III extradiol ring-cleavage dioxygenase [Rugosibacter sp.]HQQ35447.1 class III extradiol ring-cleavage dioxygenase [Rugosibacter sp.]
MTTTLPTLFLSHGSPMTSIAPGNTGKFWEALAAKLPRPKAILSVSGHWLTHQPAVTAAVHPETIHDFYGFPAPMYEIQYTPPGAVDLAKKICDLIPGIGVDPQRGLDHGAWVPLRFMYPKADIPVIQFAVMPELSPEAHYRLGQRLHSLTQEGVLIMASGSITHNLRDVQRDAVDGIALPYVIEFTDWFANKLTQRDLPALLDYRHRAPHAVRAHPSDDHLLPLYVALGAASAADQAPNCDVLYRETTMGAVAMDAYQFSAA